MRLLLIDGHYYLYRSFFAIRGLSNSKGEPTNAIYGFSKAIRRMIADTKPDRAAVIWDCGLPARRTELQPEYKQNRTEMPDDLRPQEGWLQRNVPLFGLASLKTPNTEADDLIASYAKAAIAEGADVVIATNDKDIMQMVCGQVSIYTTIKEAFALLGSEDVEKKWGVPPAFIADVLALTGDSSDNIPGVPGIGEKTAAQLVQAHGTTEQMLANIAAITPARLQEKIATHRDQIVSNRQMVALDLDLPMPVRWQDLEIRPRYPELIAALRECEFKGLLKEVEDEAARAMPAQADLFS
ncbi:flap endonuclease [Spartobacteria bacterium LR76]|nr:flap endonuclease [Spartobacteria bacterium LR76]